MHYCSNAEKTSGQHAGLISAKQAARMLGLHPNTLCKWRISGTGPRYVKTGRSVKYRLSDIENWLMGRTFSNTSQYEILQHREDPTPSGVELPVKRVRTEQ